MFKRIYLFFFTYMAAMYFGQTLLVFWMYRNGINFSEILIFYLISYVVALISIFVLPRLKLKARSSLLSGVLLSALSVAILIDISNIYQVYLSGILMGLNIIFFWMPYNIMHFKFSRVEKRGLNSGIYFLITPVIGITLQPLAGVVAEKLGFQAMFFMALSLYIIPIILLKFLPDFTWDLDVRHDLAGTDFNWATFFQGFTSRINYSLVPIFTLFFIFTPRAFGNFFGYLAILAATASLINAYFSDKMKSRKIFFYLFSTLAVLSFIPLAFVARSYFWGVFTGISTLCMYLANPFWLAFNLDHYKNIKVEKIMVIREVFLNLGYSFCALIAFFVFYFTKSTKISLLVVCLLCLSLPMVSYLQGVYRKKDA